MGINVVSSSPEINSESKGKKEGMFSNLLIRKEKHKSVEGLNVIKQKEFNSQV